MKSDTYGYVSIRGILEARLRLNPLRERVRRASNGNDEHFLEVGVGAGDVAKMFAEMSRHVTVVDADKERLAFVREALSAAGIHHVWFVAARIEDA